jgi:hypothetical protein
MTSQKSAAAWRGVPAPKRWRVTNPRLWAAQPGAAQAADVEDEGEAALDLLRPQPEGVAGLFSRARLL